MHYFRTYYKQYPQDEGQTPRREGRKGICYASQNFTFDGIFIFLAPLIFKVTSGGHPETANGRSLRPQEEPPPLNGSLAFHLQRIRRGVQIVGYNKPLFFAPTQRRESERHLRWLSAPNQSPSTRFWKRGDWKASRSHYYHI